MDEERSFAVGGEQVSALWHRPEEALASLVLAHGAGVGMRHAFMANVAEGLAERGLATLRFQFPYMEAGRRRPDPPAKAVAAIRSAAAEAAALAPDLPLFAGGKSFGGRMTSTTEAGGHLDGVRGIVFFGFPLHAAGQPDDSRAEHLMDVSVPMLFLQGTRDKLADIGLIRGLCDRLGEATRLVVLDGADHSFKVLKSSGGDDAATMTTTLDAVANWIDQVLADGTS